MFRVGFETEAAAQVAEASPQVLAALLDKSLLRWDGTARYDMHELAAWAEGQAMTLEQAITFALEGSATDVVQPARGAAASSNGG